MLVERDDLSGGLWRVAINRPEKRNALSIELRLALAEVLDRLAADASCSRLLVIGRGPAFCAGMDFRQFGGDRENKLRLVRSTRRLFSSLLAFPKPITAGIHGAAVGGGFMLALCCDQRVASRDAYFGFFEVRRGIPAPQEIVRLFAHEARARDWCETGRKIAAQEALEAGLVKRVVGAHELAEACEREARQLAQRSVTAPLRSAFEEQMRKFEGVLLPDG